MRKLDKKAITANKKAINEIVGKPTKKWILKIEGEEEFIQDEGFISEPNHDYGWDSLYFRLERKPVKGEFEIWLKNEHPEWNPTWESSWVCFIAYLWNAEKAKREAYKKVPKVAELKGLDRSNAGSINVLNLVEHLCSVEEVRQLVYNNSWGVIVRDPKKANFPENVVLGQLQDIIREALETPNLADRGKILLFLDSAPRGSVAAKIWRMFENVRLDPVFGSISPCFSGSYWERIISVIVKEGGKNDKVEIEEIPMEDKRFWSEFYYPQEQYEYDGEEFYGLNEKTINKEFVVV